MSLPGLRKFLLHALHRPSILAVARGFVRVSKEDVDGTSIGYVSAGRGPHPVLCLPGALGSAATDFGPVLEQMSKSDQFTLIGWDPPGYGTSRPPGRQFPPDFFHRDAAVAKEFMMKLGHKKFSMLGWSDGGITAFILAATQPSSVCKLVAWGSNSYVSDADMKLYQSIADMSKWSERMRAPMYSMYGRLSAQKMWSDWLKAFAWFHEQNNGNICRELLPRVACPVLLLHGAKDALVGDEHPQYLQEHLLDCRLHTYPEGKHNLHLKYTGDFCQRVTEFLLEPTPTLSVL